MFDRLVIVDWSAASRPKTGRDSIWVCVMDRDGTERAVENPDTRHKTKRLLRDLLADATARGDRVLLGFDFPFGYPAGFAKRLGLNGTPWRSTWDEIARRLHDRDDNGNDRFALAAELNRRVSNGSFPFWGCPAGFVHDFLGPRHHGRHQAEALAEKRLIDCWMVGAQACWKLAYTGSVGSQSLTGIPAVRELRDNLVWADKARVWPFETGLAAPKDAQIVFAEVWPSWWRKEIDPEYGPPHDRAQVRTVARLFATANRSGELAAWFAGDPNLTEAQRAQVIAEEAWTLGVTAPRQLKTRSPRPGVRRTHFIALPLGGGGPGGGDGAIFPSASAGNRPPRSFPPRPPATEREGDCDYLREPAAIYRRSFAIVRAEADLARFPASLRPVAVRLAHAAGDTAILDSLVWSRGAAAAGRRALAAAKPILVDSAMVAAGIIRARLPAQNPVVCTLSDPAVPELAAQLGTTRSAAAVELWRRHLDGAVVAIGNAPTALFRLLELIEAGAPPPALVLGFPVGFVGAAEAKEALAGFGRGLAYIALAGRRGGSALAAAAVNALAGPRPR